MSALSRFSYRLRQFWAVLRSPRQPIDGTRLSPNLTTEQIRLFQRMQFSEQAHAYRMFEDLNRSGQRDPDLLTAALLHDVGKIRAPLTLVERVLIVLAGRVFPQMAATLGSGAPRGARRAFVVARQHPAWGAELAAAAGVSPRACALIRDHQAQDVSGDPLLVALQEVDDRA